MVQGRHGFFPCSEEKKKKLISGTAVRGKDGNNHTQIDKKRELRNGLKAEMHKAKLGG